MAVGLVLVTLKMGRRAVKWILPAVALLAIAYGVFGDLLPGRFGHPGFPLPSFLGTLTIAEGGVWGPLHGQQGGASCREKGCQSVSILWVAVSLQTQQQEQTKQH